MDFNALDQLFESQRVKQLCETYDPYLQAVAVNKTNFSDEEAKKLAILLGNTEQAINKFYRLDEATQVPATGVEFKKHAMALISATFPNLIAEELVSVQPMTYKIGQIFFLKYLYGSNKGSIKAGQTAFDRFGVPNRTQNYTSEFIDEEILAETGAGASSTPITGNLAYVPVRPGTVTITIGGGTIKDNGEGELTGTNVTAGTIDYNSGAYSITLSSAASDDVVASYDFNSEYSPAQTIPELNLEVAETTVKARPRKLKTLYSFDAGYDLQMTHGISIDDALAEAAVQSIKTEIDSEIINDLYNQAGLTSTWSKKYDPSTMNISKREHDLTFIDEIISAGNAMLTSTRRIKPTFMVVGKWGADVLQSIGAPRFVGSGAVNPNGVYFLGTLDGYLKVYHDPYFNDNQYLLGHKGNSLLDAGYAYCPYLPLMNTQLLMMEDFLGRKGYATSYGKKMVMPQSYIKGVITNV